MGKNRQRRGRHASVQPAAASTGVPIKPCPCGGALAGPIRAAGSAVSRGAKRCAAGRVRRTVPWRQAPQARRREGSMPNGCDGINGTGRSPRARRCMYRHALPMHIVAELQRSLIGKSNCQRHHLPEYGKKMHLETLPILPKYPTGERLALGYWSARLDQIRVRHRGAQLRAVLERKHRVQPLSALSGRRRTCH
jgi:hypothetical protein